MSDTARLRALLKHATFPPHHADHASCALCALLRQLTGHVSLAELARAKGGR